MSTTHESSIVSYASVLEVPGTPDIHLRLSSMEDAVEIFDILEANREFLYSQAWTRSIRTVEDAERHTRNVKAQIDIANRPSERLAARLGCVIAGTPEPYYLPTGKGDETELRISRFWGRKL